MSWQGEHLKYFCPIYAVLRRKDLGLTGTAYVDDQLLATGKISKAAIIGKQGGIWAASSGFQVCPF
jgi:hypothetical protein